MICRFLLFSLFLRVTLGVQSPMVDEEKSPCGQIGIPDGMKSLVNANGTYSYECLDNTVLVGDNQRKCSTNGRFSGSTPACMPFFAITDFHHLNGTGRLLLNKMTSVCSQQRFSITFDKMFIGYVFIWTNSSCTRPSLETDSGTFHQNSSRPSVNNSMLHSFEFHKPLSHLRITQNCCIYRIAIPNMRIYKRCGKPDIPVGVHFEKFADQTIKFSCDSQHKLEGPSSIGCVGLEKWSHQNESVHCVPDHSSVKIIVLCSLLALVLLLLAICMCWWYISESEVKLDTNTLTRQLMARYKETKVAAKDITLLKPLNKDGFCLNYSANYKGKEVQAHVCDLAAASASKIPAVEQVRCLYAAVQFNFKHPNLFIVLALSVDPKKNPILVYEKCESLDSYVASNKKLTSKELLGLCLDVCNGMTYLSHRRIVHRNLRAKNCFVDGGAIKSAKIGNFKLCQELGTYDQFLCKTPVDREQMPWAAPETVAENMSSVASDVFSFGVLLWEVFSEGQEPYRGMTETQITTFLLDEQRLEKPKHCSNGMYKLMRACWATDADQRPSFGDLSRRIQALTA